MKELLKQWKSSICCIDVHDEYKEVETIDLGRFYNLDFCTVSVRFIPNRNPPVGNSECVAIYQHLLMLMHSGKTKDCVLVVEEARRFSNDNNLGSCLNTRTPRLKSLKQ